ncbi:hypothetical protein H2200_001530 [Cladophialophora chaetospira]|uniref:Uncharacterized protein n=1 Tax=Cladophialophora chaetospira TaxID=386627 RepID=A0AA38XLU5_9EURO|nr:hypothetical protein H2200_001530 [Cladophialophora chaetospira]
MAPKDTVHQRHGTGKTFCSSDRKQPTRSSPSQTQTRRLAYQLGLISKSKIEREASKTAPRLNKLVGHATIFDNAAKVIMQHINDSITELDRVDPISMDGEMYEEGRWFDGLGGHEISIGNEAVVTQIPIEPATNGSFNGYGQLKRTEDRHIEISTTVPGVEDGDDWDMEAELAMESIDVYSYLNREHWIDPYCKIGEGKGRQEWELSNACSRPVASSTLPQKSRDDDFLLWSQQPRVLSVKQADSLFIYAFG